MQKHNSTVIDLTSTAADKVAMTPTGLVFNESVSIEEWAQLGLQLAKAEKAIQWMIGDWLIYGEDNFSRVNPERYATASKALNLERSTLKDYAFTARRIPALARANDVPWTNYRIVARIKDEDQRQNWVDTIRDSKGDLTKRRLARSIECGRLLKPEEIQRDPIDRGIDNHHPWLTGLHNWWSDYKDSGWFEKADEATINAMLRDFAFVEDIITSLRARCPMPSNPHGC